MTELKENEKAIEKFKLRLLNLGRKQKTIDDYLYHVNRFFSVIEKPFDKVTLDDLDKFIAWKRTQEKERHKNSSMQGWIYGRRAEGKAGELKNSTLNAFYSSLRSFYRINEMPHFAGIIHRAKREESQIKIIEKSVIKKLIKHPEIIRAEYKKKSPKIKEYYVVRDTCLILFIFSVGARIGEVPELKESDLKLERKVPVVELKGKTRPRYQVLSSKWLKYYTEYKKIKPKSDFLFCSIKGSSLNTGTLMNIIKFLTGYSAHKFRHAYAVFLLENGKTIKEVSEALGHSSIKTTSVYLNLVKDSKRIIESPLDTL